MVKRQTNGYFLSFKDCAKGEKCVPYYRCNETYGAFQINIRSDIETATCESLHTCCDDEHVIDQYSNKEIENLDVCGVRNVNGIGPLTVASDNETQFGEFPWMMAIIKTEKFGKIFLPIFIAGGSLIHPSIVLTAAHTIQNETGNLAVRGGEWNTQSFEELFSHEDREVREVIMHPQFVRKNLHNDVALLFTKKPFQILPHINTICLPKHTFKSSGCIATGWGKDKFGLQGSYQAFLKKVELPLVSNKRCQERLRSTRVGEDFILDDGFRCAGEWV